MAVDNEVYDRLADTWWDQDGTLNVLRSALNPARFTYMRSVLVERLARDVRGVPTLDIGCGGGLLAEEFAGLGCQVTGIDPSTASLHAAREHAASRGLAIDYREAVGEALPFSDGSFGIAYCCDVLEHVQDVDRVLSEAARVLRPGGIFLFDTINRTLRSWVLMIGLVQSWSLTAFLPRDTHDWRHFLRPAELTAKMSGAGLDTVELVGMAPASIPAAFTAMRARAAGQISYQQMGERLRIRTSRDRSAMYLGYATRS